MFLSSLFLCCSGRPNILHFPTRLPDGIVCYEQTLTDLLLQSYQIPVIPIHVTMGEAVMLMQRMNGTVIVGKGGMENIVSFETVSIATYSKRVFYTKIS